MFTLRDHQHFSLINSPIDSNERRKKYQGNNTKIDADNNCFRPLIKFRYFATPGQNVTFDNVVINREVCQSAALIGSKVFI